MADPQVIARTLQKLLSSHTPAERLAVAQEFLRTLVKDEDKEITEIILAALLEGRREPVPVVVLVHGIRTNAQWQDHAAPILEQDVGAEVIAIKYGVFDAIRFWFPFWFRSMPINRILRELRDIQATRSPAPLYVVAHSFGTYSIANVLLHNPDVTVSRLLLCGSIVRADFRWDKLARCPTYIVNLCGTKDIWPVLAKSTSWGYGSSGTYGFGTARVHDAFFEVAHSGFFDKDFIRTHWVPFLLNGQRPSSTANHTETSLPKLLLQLFPGQWLIVLAALVMLIMWILKA